MKIQTWTLYWFRKMDREIYKYEFASDDFITFNNNTGTVDAVGSCAKDYLAEAHSSGNFTYNDIVSWFKRNTDVEYCLDCGCWLLHGETEYCVKCESNTVSDDMEQFGMEYHLRADMNNLSLH